LVGNDRYYHLKKVSGKTADGKNEFFDKNESVLKIKISLLTFNLKII